MADSMDGMLMTSDDVTRGSRDIIKAASVVGHAYPHGNYLLISKYSTPLHHSIEHV